MPEASNSLSFWHRRYQHQAGWTAALRAHAYTVAALSAAGRVLEVGSGTGVVSADLQARTSGKVFGAEIEPASTRFAARASPGPSYTVSDGAHLPFAASSFEIVATHFLLLWVKEPASILSEAVRVTRPGGWVLCMAEPDYGGRVDYPDSLANLGRLQAHALQAQGANPYIGRRIRAILGDAGLTEVTAGVMGMDRLGEPSEEALRSEWETMAADLRGLVSEVELEEWRKADLEAWRSGRRVLFVPTFYAFGRKPQR